MQVLYLDLRKDEGYERLVSLATSAQQHLADATCPATDPGRAFTPHVTIAKLSKLSAGKHWRSGQACRKIPQVLFTGCAMHAYAFSVCGAYQDLTSTTWLRTCICAYSMASQWHTGTQEAYAELVDMDAGPAVVGELQLCAMQVRCKDRPAGHMT